MNFASHLYFRKPCASPRRCESTAPLGFWRYFLISADQLLRGSAACTDALFSPGPARSARRGFDEYLFYRFGLRAGFSNLLRNGFKLGFKKTIGKITQPINSYSRFPEYALMHESLCSFSERTRPHNGLRILDVGSPKLFGLFLASTHPCEVEMTDISPLNLDEYHIMWNSIRRKARGVASFSVQDVRALSFDTAAFDVVFSMSVLEHVEGPGGDRAGLNELLRVLKPGGLLMFSVPFGMAYIEQFRQGFANAVEFRRDHTCHFFQRIYDSISIRSRFLEPSIDLTWSAVWSVWRRRNFALGIFSRIGQNLAGILGFLNPLLSSATNRCVPGLLTDVPSQYGSLHASRDVYGDVVAVGTKGAPGPKLST